MFTGTTPHFKLGIYNREDRPVDPNTDWTDNFSLIDTALKANKDDLDSVNAFISKAKTANGTMTDTLSAAEQSIADSKQAAKGLEDSTLESLVKANQAKTNAETAASDVAQAQADIAAAQAATQRATEKSTQNEIGISDLTSQIEQLEEE